MKCVAMIMAGSISVCGRKLVAAHDEAKSKMATSRVWRDVPANSNLSGHAKLYLCDKFWTFDLNMRLRDLLIRWGFALGWVRFDTLVGLLTLSEISKLPLRERAKRYRAHAHETRAKAAQCAGEIRAAFLKIAGYWEQLALEAEAKHEKQAAAANDNVQKDGPTGPSPTAG